MTVTVDASGIENIAEFFTLFPQRAAKALSIAINETARDVVLPLARKAITEQVAYPDGYLDDDRLFISDFAYPERLQATITGRDRPTSLARFAEAEPPGSTRKGSPGATVTVKPGSPRPMPRAFLVRLKNDNIGLAIRLKPGEVLRNIREFQPVELSPNVYLLYGPSVDQVFQTVASDIAPEVTEKLGDEFYRQLYRLIPNG